LKGQRIIILINQTDKKLSPYTLLNRWLYDGSNETKIPDDVRDGKEIGPQYIIWFFKNSIYNSWVNEHFNNFGVYALDKNDILKFMKKCILDCGYKPQYIPKQRQTTTKIAKILKQKHPYYKKDDIRLLVDIIDVSEEKDNIYETLGLFNPKKTKTTKKDLIELSKVSAREEVPIKKKEVIIKNETPLETFMSGIHIER
jgi:hypothetical protein